MDAAVSMLHPCVSCRDSICRIATSHCGSFRFENDSIIDRLRTGRREIYRLRFWPFEFCERIAPAQLLVLRNLDVPAIGELFTRVGMGSRTWLPPAMHLVVMCNAAEDKFRFTRVDYFFRYRHRLGLRFCFGEGGFVFCACWSFRQGVNGIHLMVEIDRNILLQVALPNHGESRTIEIMALPVSGRVLSVSAAALIMNHQRRTMLHNVT